MKTVLVLLTLLGCCDTAVPNDSAPPCPGTTITVWGDAPLGCDLTGSQTLTVLGITEADCDHRGGAWVYEACQSVDY